MSRMMKEIRVQANGERRAVRGPMRHLSADEVPMDTLHFDERFGYRFYVKWARTFFCPPEAVDHMRHQCMEELRQAIYGDIIPLIRELHMEVYGGDQKKVYEILAKLEATVHGEY